MKKLIAFVIFWVMCGYINYGLTLGYFTKRFPEQQHYDVAITTSIGGPIFMPVVLIKSIPSFNWRITHLSEEERWEIFHKMYPNLDRENFERNYN